MNERGQSDLLTPGPFVGKLPAAIDPDNLHDAYGPLLVARARADGTFSLDDEVARAHARRLCPRKPARIALPLDPDRSSANDLWREDALALVVCARLWGLPTEKVAAALAPFHALAEWATRRPPLTLP